MTRFHASTRDIKKKMCDRQSPTVVSEDNIETTCGCDYQCDQSVQGCCDDYDEHCYCHCPIGMFRDKGCNTGSCKYCTIKDKLPLGDENKIEGYFDPVGPDGDYVDFFWTTSGISTNGGADEDNCRAQLCSNYICELSKKPPRSCGASQMKGLCRVKERPETTVSTTVSTITTTDYTGPIQQFTESESTSKSLTSNANEKTTVDGSRCKTVTFGFVEGNCDTFLCEHGFSCELSEAEGLDCSGCEMCTAGKTKADCDDFVPPTTVTTKSPTSTHTSSLSISSTSKDLSGQCKNVCNANSEAKVNADMFKTLDCDSLFLFMEQQQSIHEGLICSNLQAHGCNCDGCKHCNTEKPEKPDTTTSVVTQPQPTCKRDMFCSPPARLSPEQTHIAPGTRKSCNQWTSKPYDIPCLALREHGCDCSHCTNCGADQGPPIILSTKSPVPASSTACTGTRDCKGICNGDALVDICGKCGGDGSTCSPQQVTSSMKVTSNMQANKQDATQAPADDSTKEFVIIICVAVVALVIVIVVVVIVVMLARKAKKKNAVKTVTDINSDPGGPRIHVDERREASVYFQDQAQTQKLGVSQGNQEQTKAMHAEPKIRSRNLKRFMSNNNFGSNFYRVLDTIGVSSMREVSWLTMNDLVDNGLSKSEAEAFQAASESYQKAKERRKRREQRKNLRFQSGKNRHEYADVLDD